MTLGAIPQCFLQIGWELEVSIKNIGAENFQEKMNTLKE